LMSHLRERGIGTAIHYPVPIHLQPAYRGRLGEVGSLPETERAAREIVSLPMYPELSEDDVRTVARAIREFAAQ
jgi:dTDP-4-amino-4,6-dideoxygalactose transaminase